MKISIIIPAYEANNIATKLLNELFDTIELQTYKDYEIIVADHSKSNEVKNLCQQRTFPIQHFYNERKRGNSSANMNDGIKKASGNFIKIMHMDDMFCSHIALELMANEIDKTDKKWGAFVFNHFYENEKKISKITVPGGSCIGCPSVSFFANDDNFFDENFIVLNDADMHFRLRKKYGEPIIISETCITIRIHDMQLSKLLPKKKEIQERIDFARKCHG